MRNSHPVSPGGPGRALGLMMGVVFAGVGLTAMAGLRGDDGFGAPPLIFKIFGSFIALAFVAFGGVMFFSALRGNVVGHVTDRAMGATAAPGAPGEPGYKCPACGAGLAEDADVSPKGDVKCSYCKQWFSIHG